MDAARRHPAVWLAGPPGSGKTTLVSTWLAEHGLSSLWYRVHEEDGDPATFFHYFGRAVEQESRRKRAALPHLTPEYLARLPVFSRRYFEQAWPRLKAPCAIVFDNYEQAGEASALHEVMRALVESLPEGIVAVFVSRREPPAALAAARARGDLALLDAGMLRLTAEECADIAELRGVAIEESRLQRLHERTQGWAAGLVLALEQDARDGGAAVPADATPEVLFDYFAGEIFDRMDSGGQRLLLAAALLPTMATERVVELSGDQDAGAVLARLSRANYFTVKLAAARGASAAYQFHPLFREFLLRRAEEALPAAELAALRRRAAALLEADGETASAFRLLAAAQAWDEAMHLALGHARELLAQGRGGVLEDWLRALPVEVRNGSPWVLYWIGLCRLPLDPLEARDYFEHALPLFERGEDIAGLYSAWASIVDSFVYAWGEFAALDRWIEVADGLLARHPFPAPEIEARVAAGMFMALMYRQPQRADLPRWAERAQELALTSPKVETQMMLGNQLLLYHSQCMGDYGRARVLVDAVRPQADRASVSPVALVLWRCFEAAYYVSIGAPAESARAVESALETADREGLTLMSFFLLFQGVMGKLKAGDHEGAARLLERARSAIQPGRVQDRAHYHYMLMLHAYQVDDRSAAVENGERAVRLADLAGAPFSQAFYRVALAHALFDAGRRGEALAQLARARRLGRPTRSKNFEFALYFALGYFALERGRTRRALPLLRKALENSRASGNFNRFLWTPRNLGKVVVAALEHGIEVGHAQELVRRCGLAPTPEALRLDNWPFPVRVHALGRLRVELDGEPLHFNGKAQRKPLELLMAIIAKGGRNVPELQVQESLWPDAEGDAGHQACAIALHRLRKLLGCDQAVVLRRNELTLDPAYVWVDVWAFERELAQPAGLAPAAESAASRIYALYKGSFLSQVDAPWAMSMRERLRGKFMRHVAEQGRKLLAAGQYAAAVGVYEKGLEADGRLEELYQGLMLCHSAMGRRAEAVDVYRRCETMLAATLGVTPGTKTVALYRTLQEKEA